MIITFERCFVCENSSQLLDDAYACFAGSSDVDLVSEMNTQIWSFSLLFI